MSREELVLKVLNFLHIKGYCSSGCTKGSFSLVWWFGIEYGRCRRSFLLPMLVERLSHELDFLRSERSLVGCAGSFGRSFRRGVCKSFRSCWRFFCHGRLIKPQNC